MAGSPKKRARKVEQGLVVAPASTAVSRHGDGCLCQRCSPLLHGSYELASKIERSPEYQAHLEEILATQEDVVLHPVDVGACCRLADARVRIDRSAAALDQSDLRLAENPLAAYGSSDRGMLVRLREDHARWLRVAGEIEEQLGRTPRSRARLGLHLATARRELSLAELHQQALEETEEAQP